ncbi:Oligoxyloglucan reducing end-specific cellobiohydrolase [Suillus tomentosus]|nr:Oligoxyloglucan reducing end-specific cellobiohydrolase [Suillus tomentosus]
MAPWHRTAAFIWSTLAFLLYFGYTSAADPEHAINYFNNPPTRLFFFDDTTSVIYHDAMFGDIHVSQDEGNTWKRADDIPPGEAAMFIEHPFSNRVAFVLTNSYTHYRTDDRGKSWRTFDVPELVAYVQKPLSFHSDPKKWEYTLFQATKCDQIPWGEQCRDVTYYSKDGFASSPQLLLEDVSRCQFAHSSKDFKHDAHEDLIYCVAYDSSATAGSHNIASSRLYSSTDFFATKQNEDLGIGKNAKGVVAFAIVSKFAVVALKDLTPGSEGDMLLYVTVNTKEWAKAHFPHASQARLRENAYTIVESTVHSLAVDVVLHDITTVGTLFVSNSNGTYFVESLMNTNRNMMGYVDYETIYGVEGVGIANVVANAQDVERKMAAKQLRSVITFDDGSSWNSLVAPSGTCSSEPCSLHLHSVTDMHNYGPVFSSPAPGFVMGVGSVGKALAPYDESNTYMSKDAGLTWTMVREGASQYEFGDSGSVIVVVDDEQPTNSIMYSTDMGQTWNTYNIEIQFRAKGLTTVSDSTSQKFLLLGQVVRQSSQSNEGRNAAIYLDFAALGRPQCGPNDKESWYARANTKSECIMGAKQWYTRRKADADCYMGEKFHDPEVHDDKCPCEEHDYECDYNYVRSDDKCVPSGPERIPSTQCTLGTPGETYMGSSGYRKIPGNKCEGGSRMDEPMSKDCSGAEPVEGEIVYQTHSFASDIVQSEFFKDSKTVLVRLADFTIWQSSNEGYTWEQKFPEERFLVFYMHTHTDDRAYLITDSKRFYYTTDAGRYWHPSEAPSPPNTFGAQVVRFQPKSEYLIWIGNVDCQSGYQNCRAQAQYTWNNGRDWRLVEDYVVNCDWARDEELRIDSTQILCESYADKQGSQAFFGKENALQLVSGTDYYAKKTKLFDHVVGFTKFSEFLIVAEYLPMRGTLNLQVSLDGRTFASGNFPPGMHPDSHAYTVLESSTKSIFLHMTMNEFPTPWGNILKSNSNGTYFGLSIDNVNRNNGGFVDFEKLVGLDGIAIINIVANPAEAALTGHKVLQTRITHNDGGTWKPLLPPSVDSLGVKYPCTSVGCALHVHGYTERFDARATYSSPSIVGVVMAVGNVGESLAAYTESDTFLSRDGGFTWEEVHKDAHLWEFGDSGSIIVIVNDEEPTDHVLFTTDEGLTWREFKFTTEKIRVRDIMTVPEDTSRKFMLLGRYPATAGSVIVHLDFSSLTHRKCLVDAENPGHDDFELWSPSEERDSLCLFGRQTLYHRRKRDVNCVVGDTPKALDNIVQNCTCALEDFECEFNYVHNAEGQCVLVPGMTARPPDDSCRNGEDYWYEPTAYRKVDYSSCEGGDRIDRGTRHLCPGINGHSAIFWMMVILFPFAITALVAWWWYSKSGMARGQVKSTSRVRCDYSHGSGSGAMATLASVPWFLLGLAGIAFEYIASSLESVSMGYRARRGYRDVPVDEDAQVLHFEDEE